MGCLLLGGLGVLLLGGGDGDGLGVGLLDLLGVRAADETGMALDADEEGEDGGADDGEAHDHEGLAVAGSELAEGHAEADGSGVASGADDAGDGSGDGGVDVGDDAVAGSLGALDEEGEEDHDEDGDSEALGVGEDEDHDALEEEEDGVDPKTSTHAVLGVALVGEVSAETTGEEVHPSEEGGDGGGGLGGLGEGILEVEGGGVVHGELDAEAASVLEEEDPGVEVEGAGAEGGGGGDLGHEAVLLEVLVVALGRVIGDEEDGDAGHEADEGGDDGNGAPGHLGGHAGLEKGEEDGSHDELGDAATEVAPATDEGVGGTDDLLGEHAGGPVLAHDEGAADEADEETEDDEAGGGIHKAGAGGGDGAAAQDHGEEDAGAVLVAERAEDEAHADGAGDGDDRREPDLLSVDADVGADLREERGNGEPDEEGNEEAPPRAVEGAHVRAGEVAKLDLLGLVILVGVDLEDVGLVLLGLGLCK